jgi:hypothetical protein
MAIIARHLVHPLLEAPDPIPHEVREHIRRLPGPALLRHVRSGVERAQLEEGVAPRRHPRDRLTALHRTLDHSGEFCVEVVLERDVDDDAPQLLALLVRDLSQLPPEVPLVLWVVDLGHDLRCGASKVPTSSACLELHFKKFIEGQDGFACGSHYISTSLTVCSAKVLNEATDCWLAPNDKCGNID